MVLHGFYTLLQHGVDFLRCQEALHAFLNVLSVPELTQGADRQFQLLQPLDYKS